MYAPFSAHHASRRPAQAGFTLIEIMVVVVIIGILAAVIVPNIMGKPGEARAITAKSDMRGIESALASYKLDNFNYPSTQQGLEALVSQPSGEPAARNWKGYLKDAPKDPWGNPYQYISPGASGDYDLMSYGGDGKPGGEGEAADVSSRATDAKPQR